MEVAWRYWKEHEKDKSLEVLENWRRQEPNNALVLQNLCVAQCDLSDLQSISETRQELESIQERFQRPDGGHQIIPFDVLSYNLAVLRYYEGSIQKALSILEKLMEKIHDVDEGCAAAVCCLWTDVHLKQNRPFACRSAMNHLEQIVHQDHPQMPIRWESKPISNRENSLIPIEMVSRGVVLEPYLLKYPSGSKWTPSLEGIENGERSISSQGDLGALKDLYRIKILLALGQIEEAAKETKETLERHPESLAVRFLEAEIWYVLGDWEKASDALQNVQNMASEIPRVQSSILNNVGAIQLKLDRLNFASLCFSKSLLEASPSISGSQLQITYNLGLSALKQGAYRQALTNFQKSMPFTHSNPCIWIRMAECCIGLVQNIDSKLGNKIEHRPSRNGLPDMLILPNTNSIPLEHSTLKEEHLKTADAYLQKAMALITSQNDDSRSPQNKELWKMQRAVCLKQAFVTLSLNQPERCLWFLKKLEAVPERDPEIEFCGAMYRVEALCLFDQIDEAMNVLERFISSFEPQEFTKDRSSDSLDLQTIQKTMLLNRSALLCTRQEFEKAKQDVQSALLLDPQCRKSNLAMVYIELAMGNKEDALNWIRTYNLWT